MRLKERFIDSISGEVSKKIAIMITSDDGLEIWMSRTDCLFEVSSNTKKPWKFYHSSCYFFHTKLNQ